MTRMRPFIKKLLVEMNAIRAYYEDASPEAIKEAFEQAKRMLEKDPRGWWRTFNWGTNRPPLKSVYDNHRFYLVTAWGAPIPLLAKIVEMFPSLSFDIKTEEEQGEFFCKGTISSAGVNLVDDEEAKASWEQMQEEGCVTFDPDGSRYSAETV